MIGRALIILALACAALPVTASAARITLDPGHGGSDSGAVGRLDGLIAEGLPPRTLRDGVTPAAWEKDIVLDVALRAATELRRRGWQVTLTRTTDAGAGDLPFPGTAADLAARVTLAEGSDAVVSIHANSAAAMRGSGTETYHATGAGAASVALATSLQGGMTAALGLPDRGVKAAGFYVLRNTTAPAALVEGGFMTAPGDLATLVTVAGRQRWAGALADGVVRWWAGMPPAAAPPAPPAWWVRAIVVRSRAVAREHTARLRRAGMRAARLRPAKVGGSAAWMVSLGTFPVRADAERAAATARRLGLRPQIRPVAPDGVPPPATELPRTPDGVQPPAVRATAGR